MKKIECDCTKCSITEKACQSETGKGPVWCPTKEQRTLLDQSLKEYEREEIKEFARQASLQEGACYIHRDAKPFVMIPTKSRAEELVEFCRRMGYRKLGLVFCGGLAKEAALLAQVLEANEFELVAVCCKVGCVPKERIGVKDSEKVQIGAFESMCNPIAQAMILNEAKTDFNIMMGLCIGHDSLFLKYIEGLTTVFAVKDRVTGHNPIAALYTSHSYYQRLKRQSKGARFA